MSELLLSQITTSVPQKEEDRRKLNSFFQPDEESPGEEEKVKRSPERTKNSLLFALILTIIFMIVCLPLVDYFLCYQVPQCASTPIRFFFKALLFFVLALMAIFWYDKR